MTPQQTLSALSDEFVGFTADNNLPEEGDAVELQMFANLTTDQREWLIDFCERWDAAQEIADAEYIAARA